MAQTPWSLETDGHHHHHTTHDITLNKEHIPSAEIAKAWLHLSDIAEHMMPQKDGKEIGLLRGYNCPDAFIPLKTIMRTHHLQSSMTLDG